MRSATTASLISFECHIAWNLADRSLITSMSRDYDGNIFCYDCVDGFLKLLCDILIQPSGVFDIASIRKVVSLHGLELIISYLLHRDIDEMTG